MAVALSIPQLALSLAAGGLTTLSPCVFPLLPLVLGGAVQGRLHTPLAMAAGMTVSFALVGMLVGALGPALGIDSDGVRSVGAGLLIAFAVVMLWPALGERFTRWVAPLASTANRVSMQFDGASARSAFFLGAVLGLVWSPCSGPLLGSALSLVASEGGLLRGGVMLGVFGLGASLPLMAVAYASRLGLARAREWLLPSLERLRRGFALLLLLVGVSIIAGGDRWLEAKVLDFLPAEWVELTVRL